jgi:hypothetical protein
MSAYLTSLEPSRSLRTVISDRFNFRQLLVDTPITGETTQGIQFVNGQVSVNSILLGKNPVSLDIPETGSRLVPFKSVSQ